ncbi:MAG: T9SS type A sorting domain-containing protein [Bacteroidales bacterium]|nr:T9SS type A sorting domain-containing protein [Bacteroidales bacterium]
MKRVLLLIFVLGIVFSGFAQRPSVSKDLRDFAVKKVQPTLETMNLTHDVLPAAVPEMSPTEDIIGNTYFDLQSNSSMQNRIFAYDDGTMGGVFTLGFDFPGFNDDRGTGYNYYDGSSWGAWPTERLEDDRTGWCAYSAWGESGEINVIHYAGAAIMGVAFSRRPIKGTGDWTQFDYHSPAADADWVWPRMTSGGIDNSVTHFIGLTRPIANSGAIYQGLDGALLYSRSEDGGDTWSIDGELFDEMSSSNYVQFSGDTYEIQADGDNVAILYGETWTDLGLMKSTDGGDTWTQTIIWEHPYPFFDPATPTVTDTFYCADGAHGLDFDQSGKVHIVFGINRGHSDGAGTFWFPGVGGIGYWNEDRPTFSNDLNALSPYGDPGTELEIDLSLIGWTQDINGNDTIDVLDDWGTYYLGFSSMPQILIDDMNRMFVVYSSVTEGYDNDAQSYRHLWCRTSPNGEWWGTFHHLTSELIHIFDECVWPSIASASEDNFYLVYQHDNEPGMAVRGDEDPYGENFISVMTVIKEEVWTSVEENSIPIYDYDVMQNYPNPFTGSSTVKVNVRQSTELSLEVVNMMGQRVYTVDAGVAQAGVNIITIDGTKLTPGVYFYTVRAGETAITKKMIVE